MCVKPVGLGDGAADFPLGDPIGVARAWALAGFQRLQVTDLDAESGARSNFALIEEIVRDGALEIQIRGGVQSTDQIERLADTGATRIVVGARALDDPQWLADAADAFPGILVVATDVRERRVVTRGWVRGLPVDILDLVEELSSIPLGGVLIISAQRDTRHESADLALLEDIVEASCCPVIADGVASTMNDLRALEHRGVAAVLLGGALYSGALEPRAVAREFSD